MNASRRGGLTSPHQHHHPINTYSSGSSLGSASSSEYSPSLPTQSLLLFRRASSLEPTTLNYESPGFDDDEEEEEQHEGMQEEEGGEEYTNGHQYDNRRRSDDVRLPNIPPAVATSTAPQSNPVTLRTRSVPDPHRRRRHPQQQTHSPESSLPAADPSLNSSVSWTPGLHPAGYVSIQPSHSNSIQEHNEESSNEHDQTDNDELPPLAVAPVAVYPFQPQYRRQPRDIDHPPSPPHPNEFAPLPARPPTLIRQKGVYQAHTSRSVARPPDSAERYHQQLERITNRRDHEWTRRNAPPNGYRTPSPPVHDADSDDLPPMMM